MGIHVHFHNVKLDIHCPMEIHVQLSHIDTVPLRISIKTWMSIKTHDNVH